MLFTQNKILLVERCFQSLDYKTVLLILRKNTNSFVWSMYSFMLSFSIYIYFCHMAMMCPCISFVILGLRAALCSKDPYLDEQQIFTTSGPSITVTFRRNVRRQEGRSRSNFTMKVSSFIPRGKYQINNCFSTKTYALAKNNIEGFKNTLFHVIYLSKWTLVFWKLINKYSLLVIHFG